jgi:hypothetical protein
MNARLVCLVSGLVLAVGMVAPNYPAQAATKGCPEASAVAAATGVAVKATSDDNSCSFLVNDTEVSIEFLDSDNPAALYAEKKADAQRRSAPVAKTKVGKYPGFTGTASGQARLYYNQNKLLVYVGHVEISARSAGILKALSPGLGKTTLPAKLTSCAKLTPIVKKAVTDATFTSLNDNSCSYKLSDDSSVFIGTDPETSYADILETFQAVSDSRGLQEFTSGNRSGFAYEVFDVFAVVNLGDRVAELTANGFTGSGLEVNQAIAIAKLLT